MYIFHTYGDWDWNNRCSLSEKVSGAGKSSHSLQDRFFFWSTRSPKSSASLRRPKIEGKSLDYEYEYLIVIQHNFPPKDPKVAELLTIKASRTASSPFLAAYRAGWRLVGYFWNKHLPTENRIYIYILYK